MSCVGIHGYANGGGIRKNDANVGTGKKVEAGENRECESGAAWPMK